MQREETIIRKLRIDKRDSDEELATIEYIVNFITRTVSLTVKISGKTKRVIAYTYGRDNLIAFNDRIEWTGKIFRSYESIESWLQDVLNA